MAYTLSKGKWLPYTYLRVLSQWLVEAALGQRRRIIVTLPPRHGKSELISRWFPTWFLDNFPDKRVALCSYGAALAARHGRWVRNAIRTQRKHLRVRLKPNTTAANDWETTAGGGMVAAGVDGPLTGMGFNVGIIDDPFKNRAEADSETQRENVRDWYTSTFYTRAEPDASIIILQTRWHEDDLVGWLLEEAKNGGEQWDVLNLPAIAEEDDQLGRAVGEALCRWRYDEEDLARIKRTLGSRDWIALYQQRPSPDEGDIFKRTWWRRYQKDQLPRLDQQLISVDASFKNTKTSDFVAIQVWGRAGPDFYLLHQVKARMTFTQTVSALRGVCAQWTRAGAKLVEDKANGTAVMDSLRKEISGLIPVEPEGGKVARAWAVQPLCEAGNVWLPEDSANDWVADFVETAAAFPNGKHDDDVDAMTQALNYLRSHGAGVAAVGGRKLTNWSALNG